jgi:hypothetical protein
MVPTRLALCPSPLLWCAFSNPCPLHCALLFYSIVYSVFFLQSVQGVMLVYPRGGWGIPCDAWLSSVWSAKGFPSIFGDGRWQRRGALGCLFSQCIVAWRSLSQARGSGCQSFNSPLCFNSDKCGSSISARSLYHGAHTVCICVPLNILSVPC